MYKIDNTWLNVDLMTHVFDAPEIDQVTVFFAGNADGVRFIAEEREKVLYILEKVTTEIL